jgi:hypothetical protein
LSLFVPKVFVMQSRGCTLHPPAQAGEIRRVSLGTDTVLGKITPYRRGSKRYLSGHKVFGF